MALRILLLILTLTGICVTNGVWVGVDMNGVVVVGKTGSLLGVFTDEYDTMVVGTCWL